MTNTIGIKQRLREAKNRDEVAYLMMEGHQYEYASKRTRRQWMRICREKIKTFNREFLDAEKKGNI